MIPHIIFSVSITVMSWVAAMMIGAFFKKTRYYESVSNLNFVSSRKLNKRIGLGAIKWIVKNTWFKYFNPALKLGSNTNMEELRELRSDMTIAEINHLIGFGLVILFMAAMVIKGEFLLSVIMITVNTLMNLYPSLLQQENKRRIDKLIKRYENSLTQDYL